MNRYSIEYKYNNMPKSFLEGFGTKEELLKQAYTYMRNNHRDEWEEFSTQKVIKFVNRDFYNNQNTVIIQIKKVGN